MAMLPLPSVNPPNILATMRRHITIPSFRTAAVFNSRKQGWGLGKGNPRCMCSTRLFGFISSLTVTSGASHHSGHSHSRGAVFIREENQSPELILRHPLSTFTARKSSRAGEPFEEKRITRENVYQGHTIYALSTASGPAAIAIVRVSGPLCKQIYQILCPSTTLPRPRMASVRALYSPPLPLPHPRSSGELADQEGEERVCLDPSALILYFPGPKSYTGQDMMEFHIHGGVATVKAVMAAIPKCYTPQSSSSIREEASSIPSRSRARAISQNLIRPAQPGEFTQLAFYAGRLSLPQVESLSAVLSASTEQARVAATRGSSNVLSNQYESWRHQLISAMGEFEALIDFSDDQGFEQPQEEFIFNVREEVKRIVRQIKVSKMNATRGELLRDGIKVSLLGKPNAGKSSLLNLIVGREAAIVSTEAGTTRDVVEVNLDVGGWLVRLGDTAGLRHHARDDRGHNGIKEERIASGVSRTTSTPSRTELGVVEQEGIRRAKQQALDSDVVLVILGVDDIQDPVNPNNTNININSLIDPEVISVVKQLQSLGRSIIFVLNKIDIIPSSQRERVIEQCRNQIEQTFPNLFVSHHHHSDVIPISCFEAEHATTPTTPQEVDDPGAIHALVSTLARTFSRITTAIRLDDETLKSSSAITTAPCTSNNPNYQTSPTNLPASFWRESLGATSRQRILLEQSESHLYDFLDVTRPSFPTNPEAVGNVEKTGQSIDNGNDNTKLDGADCDIYYRHNTREEEEIDIVIAAEHLRSAADCLAQITGRVGGGDVESILGVVFERFCVGK